MAQSLLEPEYEAKFIDDTSYPRSTPYHLRGLAAAIQDAQTDWRPSLTEIIAMLPRDDFGISLISAGTAYGAAKQLKDGHPGPSLLLLGAALNAIGNKPESEWKEALVTAKNLLRQAGLIRAPAIELLYKLASERAEMGRTSQMLRNEFADGLRRTGKYTEAKIREVAEGIVNVTHDVRHRAVVNRFGWSAAHPIDGTFTVNPSTISPQQEFWDSLLFKHPEGTMLFGKSFFWDLLPYALEGCAHAIYARVEALRAE